MDCKHVIYLYGIVYSPLHIQTFVGIDFADDKARAVIITGLPFAPYLDPKVKLKRVSELS